MFKRLIGLATVLLSVPALAFADSDWVINSFNSQLSIQPSGQVLVTETLNVNFPDPKHGIYRTLPLMYSTNEDRHATAIQISSVVRDGIPEPYQENRNTNNLEIVIGDANQTIAGPHTYTLSYTITGALRSFDGYDELYWDVTGNEWDVPITQASANITLPSPEILQTACYQGAAVSTQPCSTQTHTATTARFSGSNLAPQAGLTVAVGYTPGIVPILTVTPPRAILDLFTQPLTWIILLLSIAAGIIFLIRRWWRYGRDFLTPSQLRSPFFRPVIVARYSPPPLLTPAESGLLLREYLVANDLTAAIIDLANRGHLTISSSKSGIFSRPALTLTRQSSSDRLSDFESKLLDTIFFRQDTVTNKDLEKIKPAEITAIKRSIRQSLTDKKLFTSNPHKIRNQYALAGALMIGFTGIAFAVSSPLLVTLPLTLASLLTGLFTSLPIIGLATLVTAPAMPQRSAVGRTTLHHLLGYRLFLNTTEKHRQKFVENQSLFTELLPYAVLFGLTEKISHAFAKIGLEPPAPAWYSGTAPFNAAVFAHTLTQTTHTLSSALSSASSHSGSSGGGSVGGGFGGGGGGSW